mgnify:CR=1 FL=1
MLTREEWLRKIVLQEISQKREEGCDTSEIERVFRERGTTLGADELESLWRRLFSLEPDRSFGFVEPSDLAGIRAQRLGLADPDEVRIERLEDRMLGAWLGRCVGCLLGKPVEGWSRRRIEEYLKEEDSYPLRDYFPRASGEDVPGGRGVFRGEIQGMPRDDDVDYTILGLHILESFGTEVTSEQIADEWLSHLQYASVYTAEREAYRNLADHLPVPETAVYLNPYREWIGAQIRADPWGYVMAGRPVAAADLAFKDARISHVKNGIYGEMMAAAMVASAFTASSPEEIVRTGLAVIPAKSRLAEAVRRVLDWSRRVDSWEKCFERVEENYGHYSPVHTINNMLNIVLALMYGGGDFTRSISIAVMAGWDTDCNGATTGSVMGAFVGAAAIPDRWAEPISDVVRSYVRGFEECSISDLSSRMVALVNDRS